MVQSHVSHFEASPPNLRPWKQVRPAKSSSRPLQILLGKGGGRWCRESRIFASAHIFGYAAGFLFGNSSSGIEGSKGRLNHLEGYESNLRY